MKVYGMGECDVCFDLIDSTSRRQAEFMNSRHVCCFMGMSRYEKMLDMTNSLMPFSTAYSKNHR